MSIAQFCLLSSILVALQIDEGRCEAAWSRIEGEPIKQVLANLVMNGVQAMSHAGTVTVTVGPQPGLEFLSVLREAEWPTPFILITGFGDESTHERALRLGASAVFDKPFDIDDLKRTVLAVLIGDGSAPVAGGGAARTSGALQDNSGME